MPHFMNKTNFTHNYPNKMISHFYFNFLIIKDKEALFNLGNITRKNSRDSEALQQNALDESIELQKSKFPGFTFQSHGAKNHRANF